MQLLNLQYLQLNVCIIFHTLYWFIHPFSDKWYTRLRAVATTKIAIRDLVNGRKTQNKSDQMSRPVLIAGAKALYFADIDSAEVAEQVCAIVAEFISVGRTSEAGDIPESCATWDPYQHLLYIDWSQMKVANQKLSAFGPDGETFWVDFNFVYGIMDIMGGGMNVYINSCCVYGEQAAKCVSAMTL